MLKKLIAIVLVTELGMRYLPKKYNFVNIGNLQTAETINGKIDMSINKKSTVSTLPEMSGIKDKTIPTTPVSNVILEEAPMASVIEPKESTNPITPQNDLPTADIWFTFDQETNTITGYNSFAPSNVNIPSTIRGVPVYNIGDHAFTSQRLTGLTLPNGLKTIGSYAFDNQLNIAGNLVIPDSVTSIGNYAFYNCSSLTNIKIGNSVNNIGDHSFTNCNSITSITIPNSVISIGDHAFDSCSGLTKVTIPDSVTSIGTYAFAFCTGLINVTIGNSVTSIGEIAFLNCDNLTRIDIPSKNDGEIIGTPWGAPGCTSVYWKDTKQIDDYLFSTTTNKITKYMGNATKLSIPSMLIADGISYPVQKIGEYAVQDNYIIKNVTIPDSVTSIEYAAFYECQGLTSVTIPESVTSIGGSAFYDCSNLKNIRIPNSVTSMGIYAFGYCTGLSNVTIGNSVTSIGTYAFGHCTGLTSVTIPDSVTSIENKAFYGCTSLTKAIISKNITSMASNVFGDTPALQTIYMKGSRSGLPTSIINAQPWGAPDSTKVLYAGEFVTFDHTVKKVVGQYNRIIDIRAFLNKPSLINRIMLPNGMIKYIGKSDWPDETGYYPYGSITEEAITTNGTYVFKGYGDDNVEQSYSVVINDIGIITLRANEASITEQVAATESEQDVLDLLNVSAEDEAGAFTNGTDCTFWISPEDMNKIHALHLGDVTTIRVNVKSTRSGKEMTSYRDVTLNTTSCVIHADNVELWPPQITNLTKEQLLDLMHVSVVDSEGVADMTKLDISDEDFNKIKTGTPGIYNVMLTYATNKAKKRVQVTIMDDSPSVLIKIPSDIKMKNIPNDSVYGVGADETVSIQPFVNTTLYSNPFKIETDPSFWLKSTAPDATVFNQMKVVVLNANDQPLSDNKLLATLSGSTIQSVLFKLRGYHNKWNSKGAYSGIMTFTITYGDSTP